MGSQSPLPGRLGGDGDMNPGMSMDLRDGDLNGGTVPRREAAVLIPFVERPSGTQVLLTKRADHLRHHKGQISFPGGRIERADPSPVEAALRETHEEVGIPQSQVDVIGELSVYRTRTGFDINPILGLVRPPLDYRADPSEVDEIFEMPLEFLLDPANHEMHSRVFQGYERYYYVIPYLDYNIWGATAAMLINVAELLSGERAEARYVRDVQGRAAQGL